MISPWMVVGPLVVVAVLLLACLRPWLRSRREAARHERLKQRFAQRREWLEARFLTLASNSGMPRGLRWVDCDFDNAVTFARDRSSGELRAFVAVTIRFEAIEGGGMEGVEAVGNLRAATAVFGSQGDEWSTQGRAVFNLSPEQTVRHFDNEVEAVEEP